MLEQLTLYVIVGALAIVLATITLAVIKVRTATKMQRRETTIIDNIPEAAADRHRIACNEKKEN